MPRKGADRCFASPFLEIFFCCPLCIVLSFTRSSSIDELSLSINLFKLCAFTSEERRDLLLAGTDFIILSSERSLLGVALTKDPFLDFFFCTVWTDFAVCTVSSRSTGEKLLKLLLPCLVIFPLPVVNKSKSLSRNFEKLWAFANVSRLECFFSCSGSGAFWIWISPSEAPCSFCLASRALRGSLASMFLVFRICRC